MTPDPDRIIAGLSEADHQLVLRAIKLAFLAGEEKGRYDSGRITRPLLEPPLEHAPPGCHCTEKCMAPVVMGRQQPCRDPDRFSRRPPTLAGDERCLVNNSRYWEAVARQ